LRAFLTPGRGRLPLSFHRQVHLTSELPTDLADAILEDLDNLRAPGEVIEDGDTLIG
jgi:hypothetical protein